MTTPARCSVVDLFSVADFMGPAGETKRKVTDEGFLVAPGALARTGMQPYTAKELGFDKLYGVDSNKVYKLHRAPEDVFDPEAMASFENKPMTFRHPPGNVVNAKNWRDHAVGDMQGIGRVGDHLGGTLTIRDESAIKAIQNGTNQISLGYSFEPDMTPVKAADGTMCDGSMKKIRGNHGAVVDNGRAGYGCRIADSANQRTREKKMAKFVIDGINLELEDKDGEIVQRALKTMQDKVVAADAAAAASLTAQTAAETARDTAVAALATAVADHATALAAAQAKVPKPGEMEALAAERAKVVGDAKILAPDLEVTTKMSVAQIRAAVIGTIIAGDSDLKEVVEGVLDGADPAKPESTGIVKAAFNGALKTHEKLGDRQVSTADAALSRGLSGAGIVTVDRASAAAGGGGNGGNGNNGAPALVGREKWISQSQWKPRTA